MLAMQGTRWIFAGIVAVLAVQRLAELRISQRNERRLLARGGVEYASEQLKTMKGLHGLWFVAMLVEVFWLRRPFVPGLAAAALAVLAAGQLLRYAAIRTLGTHWTVKIICVPGVEPVDRGIYRAIRHPNYLGVALEILSAPLLHSAWATALAFSLANGLVLWKRIRAEEQVLRENNGYDQCFGEKPRFVPRFRNPRRLRKSQTQD